MPRLSTLWLNDTDTSRLGLVVRSWTGFGEPPRQFHEEEAVLGRAGVLLTDSVPRVRPLEGVIRGTLRAASAADLATAADQLTWLATAGLVEIRLSPWPDRVWRGKASDCTVRAVAPQAASRDAEVVLGFRCQDPTARDRRGVVVAMPTAGTRYAARLGTAASASIWRIYGSATNPTLRVRRADGTVMGELALTITLGVNDWLEVDMGWGTLTRSTDGVVTDAITTPIVGDFLTLDPSWGDPLRDVWPTLECTSGAADVRYWRCYR